MGGPFRATGTHCHCLGPCLQGAWAQQSWEPLSSCPPAAPLFHRPLRCAHSGTVCPRGTQGATKKGFWVPGTPQSRVTGRLCPLLCQGSSWMRPGPSCLTPPGTLTVPPAPPPPSEICVECVVRKNGRTPSTSLMPCPPNLSPSLLTWTRRGEWVGTDGSVGPAEQQPAAIPTGHLVSFTFSRSPTCKLVLQGPAHQQVTDGSQADIRPVCRGPCGAPGAVGHTALLRGAQCGGKA